MGQASGGKEELLAYPCSVLDLVDAQLHGHIEAVQDVSTEHQGVYGGVDGMDPTCSREGKRWAGVQRADMWKLLRRAQKAAEKMLGLLA